MFFIFDGKFYAVDSVPVMIAAYCLLAEWHDGQWSQRYERMCMIGELLEREGISDPFKFKAEHDYEEIIRHLQLRAQLAHNVLNSRERKVEFAG